MEDKQKILLIRLSSLGDVIFNIPLANCLKAAGYEVTWLVSERAIDVIQGNPCTDDVILAPITRWTKEKKFFETIKEHAKIMKEINERNFDIIIDTQGGIKSLIFTLLAKVKRKIGGSDCRELSFLGINEKISQKKDWSKNVVEKYLNFARYLGIHPDKITMTLPEHTSEIVNTVNSLLEIIDRTKPVITMCPTTTWKTKHWEPNNWKELVQRLGDKYNIIFTGTKKDYNYIEDINQGKYLNLAGKTGILELAEIFRKSDLVITLDNGSLHLADAANAKAIIAIFCGTPKTYYGPVSKNSISLGGNLSCQPCHKRKCPLKTNECTKVPTVDAVLEAINSFNL